MDFILPPNDSTGEQNCIENKSSIVLIGRNGAGKTRMSRWIEQYYRVSFPNNSPHRISAQKTLQFPEIMEYTDAKSAREAILNNHSNEDETEKTTKYDDMEHCWMNDPDIKPSDDAKELLNFLFSDHVNKNLEFRNQYRTKKADGSNVDDMQDDDTCIESVLKIWNDVVKHGTLKMNSGRIFMEDDDGLHQCGLNGLSDGEREVIYLIGEVLVANPESIIIVDEPENLLHKAILCDLWDKLEKERKDCGFLYVTHDFDFALSRKNSRLIWVHGIHVRDDDEIDWEICDDLFSGATWDYEEISSYGDISKKSKSGKVELGVADSNEDDPDEVASDVEDPDEAIAYLNELSLEILGSRKNVLLVEGSYDSIDFNLYSRVYPDYNVIPVRGCNELIGIVKSYKQKRMAPLTNLNVVGIIDRDRKSDNQVKRLKKKGIYVSAVSQIEHLFIMPEVIELVCEIRGKKESAKKLNEDAENILFDLLGKPEKFDWIVLLRSTNKLKFMCDQICGDEKKLIGKPEFYTYKRAPFEKDCIDFDAIKEEERQTLNDILNECNFKKAIAVYNDKELVRDSGIPDALGFANAEDYIDFVLSCVEDDTDIGKRLIEAFRGYIGV